MIVSDTLKLTTAILASTGTAAAILQARSSFLSKTRANHIPQKDRLHYASQLEQIMTDLAAAHDKTSRLRYTYRNN